MWRTAMYSWDADPGQGRPGNAGGGHRSDFTVPIHAAGQIHPQFIGGDASQGGLIGQGQGHKFKLNLPDGSSSRGKGIGWMKK